MITTVWSQNARRLGIKLKEKSHIQGKYSMWNCVEFKSLLHEVRCVQISLPVKTGPFIDRVARSSKSLLVVNMVVFHVNVLRPSTMTLQGREKFLWVQPPEDGQVKVYP